MVLVYMKVCRILDNKHRIFIKCLSVRARYVKYDGLTSRSRSSRKSALCNRLVL